MEGPKDGDVQLMCTSDGWFPQPLVQWMDRQGEAMPSFSEALSQDSRGLFHVETALLVARSSIVNVTCSISNPLLGERKTASFSFSESRMNLLWIILLMLGLLLVVAVGLSRRKSRKKADVIPDLNTAHSRSIDSEETTDMTHGHLDSQIPNRDLTTCSSCRARRHTSQGGGTERWRVRTGEESSPVL